jgi:demethylmenaquinone methyltransferase/2-methoxy-6-polyprenyl-1,4-benzoquinol methylase
MVREMFDRIAGRYDLLNTLMTAGLNRLWNRKVLRATGLRPGCSALDLACGTGTLTRDLAKKVGPEGHVLGIDFSREMLRAAQPAPNIEYRLGDATDLRSVPSGAFDAATIAYGARNIPDLDAQVGRGRGVPGDSAANGHCVRRILRSLVRQDRSKTRGFDLRRPLSLLVSARIRERVRIARRIS